MNEKEFHYLEDEAHKELQEKQVPVLNFMEERGLPSRESMRTTEISGKESVAAHFEPFRNKETPNVMYGVPHGGELVPQEIYERMNESGHESLPLIDVGTNDVFRSNKIASAEFKMSRFVVDPNRAPDFTPDGQVQVGKPPGKILWKEVPGLGKLYQEGLEPDEHEIRKIAEQFYLPYYNTMMGGIGTLLDRRKSDKERVLVVDGHSFPVTENIMEYFDHYGIEDPLKEFPMFVLGDRDGEACDEDIAEAFAEILHKQFEELFEEEQQLLLQDFRGDIVGRNVYLKGVHNVQFWGAREQGANALQLELNELAYVDRDWSEKNPGFQKADTFRYNADKMRILQRIIENTSLRVSDKILKST